ncbi:hypothetical protein [Streptomyces sp. NPDC047718]|uniref:hypothetical protein n=1 Tax=Streptomyces sp. NPDC047718 TaxID=3155479 RepID=UPI003409A68C
MTENPLAAAAPDAPHAPDAPDTPDGHDRWAFVAPLLSTLLTLPMGLLALFYAGLSPMGCDSCDTQQADAFDASFEVAWTLFLCGLALVLVLLVACWALPWQRRNAARRVLLALAAPGTVVLSTLVFSAMLDLP